MRPMNKQGMLCISKVHIHISKQDPFDHVYVFFLTTQIGITI